MSRDLTADAMQSAADLIFTLAGARIRKLYSWELYQQGKARRLMLSTSRFELRKFAGLPVSPKPDLIAMAAAIPAPERHCCVLFEAGEAQVIWVRKRRLGTMTEIEFLGKWLRENPEIKSVRVVSSGYHLRRIRWCCRYLLPGRVQVEYSSTPGEQAGMAKPMAEWPKLAIYLAALSARRAFLKLRS